MQTHRLCGDREPRSGKRLYKGGTGDRRVSVDIVAVDDVVKALHVDKLDVETDRYAGFDPRPRVEIQSILTRGSCPTIGVS